jgi:RNA polymerase sigma factor (TIGR02999 family)
MAGPRGEVTVLLDRLRAGDHEAGNQLIPLIYSELRRMAGAYLQRERPGNTLQPTALVNEAYLRLLGGQPAEWQNRAHFFAVAAHTMRQVLVDCARRRHAEKRGGADARKIELIDDQLSIAPEKLENILAVEEALEHLARFDPQQSRLVELRFFAGLSVEEAAEVLGVSPVKISREWRSAKAWLRRVLAARPV